MKPAVTGPELRSPTIRFFLLLLCPLSILLIPLIGDILFELIALTGLSLAFLVASAMRKKGQRFMIYSDAFYTFFVFATTVVVSGASGLTAVALTRRYTTNIQMLAGFLVETFAVVASILLLTKASDRPLSTLYLQQGNFRLGLKIGLPAFFVLLISIIVGTPLLFAGSSGVTFARVVSLMPVVLLLSAFNAPKEELWFRGLFLRKYEPLVGKTRANLLQAPIFALAHFTPQYLQLGIVFFVSFIVLVFSLGLVWGHITQRTESILGSSLFHAGADIGVYLPLLLFTVS